MDKEKKRVKTEEYRDFLGDSELEDEKGRQR